MTEEEVRQMLRERCEASSQRAVAREFGVSEVFIHKVVKKGEPFGVKILEAMGLTRTVTYIPCKGAGDVK